MNARISQKDFQLQVRVFRIIAIAAVCLVVYCAPFFDQFIDYTWRQFLYRSTIFRHDTFEPMLASVWFLIVISCWYEIDMKVKFLDKYRIHNTTEEQGNKSWKGRESALWNEGAWYLLPLIVIDYFFPRRKLQVQPPTFAQMSWEIFLSLFLYDLLFFFGHYFLMHKIPYLYRTIHSRHHDMPIIRATDAIRHTALDGTLDVLCSVIALKLSKAHFYSRAIYNIIAITLITEAHCGMNLPFMLNNLLPFHVYAGCHVHDLHHQKGNVNFQKYFTYLDYMFGTLCLPLNKEEVEEKS
jgi:sterol desaturase/sphingolipid hydroxylase (fatty acid hydroxylase superfamily)